MGAELFSYGLGFRVIEEKGRLVQQFRAEQPGSEPGKWRLVMGLTEALLRNVELEADLATRTADLDAARVRVEKVRLAHRECAVNLGESHDLLWTIREKLSLRSDPLSVEIVGEIDEQLDRHLQPAASAGQRGDGEETP